MLKTLPRWMIIGLIFSASACNKSGLRGGAAIGVTEPETTPVTEETPTTPTSTVNADVLAENIADMVITPNFKGNACQWHPLLCFGRRCGCACQERRSPLLPA
jgi:hypothetical protein